MTQQPLFRGLLPWWGLLLLTEDGFCPRALDSAVSDKARTESLGCPWGSGGTMSIPGCQYPQAFTSHASESSQSSERDQSPEWVCLDLGLLPPILGKSHS